MKFELISIRYIVLRTKSFKRNRNWVQNDNIKNEPIWQWMQIDRQLRSRVHIRWQWQQQKQNKSYYEHNKN